MRRRAVTSLTETHILGIYSLYTVDDCVLASVTSWTGILNVLGALSFWPLYNAFELFTTILVILVRGAPFRIWFFGYGPAKVITTPTWVYRTLHNTSVRLYFILIDHRLRFKNQKVNQFGHYLFRNTRLMPQIYL